MSFLSDDDSLEGKSWVELCDAEQAKEESLLKETQNVSESNSITDTICATKIINDSIEEGEIRDDYMIDNAARYNSTQKKTDKNVFQAPKNVTTLSYAKVLQGNGSLVETTRVVSETASTEDLSLTSHLDVFHVVSPCKAVADDSGPVELEIMMDEDTIMFSPCKKEKVPVKNMKRPFMSIDAPVQKKCKEEEQSMCDDGTDRSVSSTSSRSSPSSKRELEDHPGTLYRRQKQIDYGKNTLGYETYLKKVAKSDRGKDDPKTPPKHLKMSRRAWDGLVRNWRQKLHRWDPVPSEANHEFDNANFDRYSSSSEDPSTYDSSSVISDSIPSSPKQHENENEGFRPDEQKLKAISAKESRSRYAEKGKKAKNEDDEYLGCEPLAENCVKACS